MEFNKKLQELRNSKGLTQEELAACLYVSRTAISKWESGRGYPSIDSLKTVAKFFNVTIDKLLSANEMLSAVEEDNKKRDNTFCDLIFGLLDISVVILFFLPLFGFKVDDIIYEVSLIAFNEIMFYLKTIYLVFVSVSIIYGILILSFQTFENKFWKKFKYVFSLLLNVFGILLFTISTQPYPAILILLLFLIKLLIFMKFAVLSKNN